MAEMVECTILVDNTAQSAELATEHGLSMWIRVDGKNILFDTGMGTALQGNAATLGVDLGQTHFVVLSHGHYDHTGGLAHVFEKGATPRVFMHPNAVSTRYGSLQAQPPKPIGMRSEIVEFLSAKSMDTIHTTRPTQITEHVWVTGPVPRKTAFEDTGGPFFLDENCLVKDLIDDDQSVWIDTAEGIVLLLGCAHSGLVNTLDYVAEVTGTARFRAVIGGMHLLNASPDRLKATINALKRYQVQLIAPCHCTGESVIPFLSEHLLERCALAGAGSHFSWRSRE
jgi:7,8-dihydropterin-6-yl-methyl-4-(beta-D-ribofuranosyl)aminobenzene 5'-phosphate synthase